MHLLTRLVALELVAALCASYLKSAVMRLPSGVARIVASIPLLVINSAAPFLFDMRTEFISRGCTWLLLTWLGNFKILGLALDRGPLCQSLTPLQFFLIYTWPITPKEKAGRIPLKPKSSDQLATSAGSKAVLFAQSGLKAALLVLIVNFLRAEDFLPSLVRELTQAFSFYWWLGSLMDGPGALVGLAAGLEVAPHFNAPYLSASISEFWARRWNLTVGNALRFLAYDPVLEGRLVASDKPFKYSKARRAVAICWAFTVSAVMHEIFIWYLDSRAVNGQWFAFFIIQGPIVLAEARLAGLRAARGASPIPRGLAVPATVAALLLLGHALFFPPIVNPGLVDIFYDCILAGLPRLPRALDPATYVRSG